MIYKIIVFLIFGMNLVNTKVQIGEDGYCTEENISIKSTNGTESLKKERCCRHYEEKNNTCIECKIGYYSNKGELCQRCRNDMYGKKCSFSCNCRHSHRCDNVKGCISIEESVKSFTSTTPKNKANSLSKSLNLREIIVYSICAGVFVFFILMCVACQRRYKYIYGNLKKYQTESRRGQNKPELSFPDIPSEGIAGPYELIDESNMIENIANVIDNSNSCTDTNENNFQLDSKDYITPYQPINEGSDHNKSNGNQTEFSATTQPYHPTINYHHSISPSCDVNGSISYCIDRYVPIVNSPDNDIHEYVFTDEANECGSPGSEIQMKISRSSGSDIHMRISDLSGSETQLKISGHLNPYQPIIISARDSHEYKSLNVSDDLRLSSLDTSIDLK